MNHSQEWAPQAIQAEVDALKHKPGALLPILHALQDRIGFIPEAAVPIIADALHQTRAEVHGVISFYHHFRTTPPGRHVVQICRAEACQSVGARQLEAHAKARLGVDYHQTTPDREITLEAVYCLGNCACGPSIRVDDSVRGRVTPDAFDALVDELQTRPLEVMG
ncbi:MULTISPECIES: formate dehydrogenase subunit gamma [Halomonadaceae]|jgi:formate dehydrogenase subunit gamma|uniref:formate dehydrogenase subunit gamma n=1 Tax=Halomonadaceae TaxID=28256 RepID=UPI0012F25D14|nr:MULTISPECIES: formate dehydrogenase subunit gamma [Halomonas]CAD5262867.1 Formate dehydrogenase subunit gamma [Halomonas sp. 113]CAD5264786.1 Formate dehydrogenase subunit gamma [Halomonas sp. 59]CAD5277658.1 NAD-dependent formate dehydrogenase gamma subunit [Halomonas sp. I3]CAD5285365.1 Formate dehydrogenase subunit gamma [Halomonas sp. 156]VXB51559.1 Formate dehydrogenase subunit gamma [Halomonas titanicae]